MSYPWIRFLVQFSCEFFQKARARRGPFSTRPLVVTADVPLAPLEPLVEGGAALEELLPAAFVRVQGCEGCQEAGVR